VAQDPVFRLAGPADLRQPSRFAGRDAGDPSRRPVPQLLPRTKRIEPTQPTDPSIRYIPLTKGLYAIVDAADYEWLSKYKWFTHGRGKKACAARNEKRRTITMHREIMQPPPGMFVDHINHNRKDNRRCNLRNCTPPQNVRNRRVCGSKSGFIGVYAHGRKWKVVVTCNGKRYRLCGFTDKIEAALARDRLARQLFGEFAYLNFPDRQPRTPPTSPPDQPQPKPAPAQQPNGAKEGT